MEAETPILVALLPKPQDLAWAQQHHWYRVPAAHAPTTLSQAQRIAFYQPASFGPQKWRIEWWAEIQGIVVTTRVALLPDEPHHPRATEPYWRIDLGPLHPLEPPLISQKGQRLLFLQTTWGRLCAATQLSDLRPPRPIADDPLYHLIQSQIDDTVRTIPDPDTTHQPRLFREGAPIFYEVIPDW